MSAPAAKRQVRGFLSYAHRDARLVGRLRDLLGQRFEGLRGLAISVWWDEDILIGRAWDDEIRIALKEADFGLLLVSPALLSRDYIREVEIPALLNGPGPVVMPVGLRRVDFARSDLQGIDARQIFLYRTGPDRQGRWFADLAGENRERFCDALVAQIVDRLGSR
jgi:hypothetical protein